MIRLEDYSIDTISKVATIGYFDGVHKGHLFILQQLKDISDRLNMKSMVLSFTNHPRLLFTPDSNLKLLTLPEEKSILLEKFGIDYSLFLDFTYELAAKSSRDFIEYIAKNLGVKVLVVGYDHHFGSDRDSNFSDYISFGKEFGIDVVCCDAYNDCDVNVSSSKVRDALTSGDIRLAKKFLGYDYFITGNVVQGNKIGRLIGFPTANLQIDNLKLLPADGVYAVGVKLEDDETIYRGMLNIGKRPTVNGQDTTIEVHIIDINRDLYNSKITLFFKDFVRNERKFDDIEALKNQLEDDLSTIKGLF